MSKRSRLPQSARHILIYDDDWEFLEARFGSQGIKPIGVSNVIRALIHQRITAWREAEARALSESATNQSTQTTQSEGVENSVLPHKPTESKPITESTAESTTESTAESTDI
jgi:hypothetical protein